MAYFDSLSQNSSKNSIRLLKNSTGTLHKGKRLFMYKITVGKYIESKKVPSLEVEQLKKICGTTGTLYYVVIE